MVDDDSASVGSGTDKSEHRKHWATFQRSLTPGGKGSARTEKIPAEIATKLVAVLISITHRPDIAETTAH
eukprot:3024759-Alexandrium_andersonii.AAC.1